MCPRDQSKGEPLAFYRGRHQRTLFFGAGGRGNEQILSATTVSLLRVAAEIVGGTRALAEELDIGETLLSKYMADSPPLPDLLLLRAVDIILADRQSRLKPPAPPALATGRTNPDGPS